MKTQTLQDVGPNLDYATINHSESARGFCAEIENAAAIEWAPIVYRDRNASAGLQVRHPHLSTKWQCLMRCCKSSTTAGIVGGNPEKGARLGLSRMSLRGKRRRDEDC
jgi:hypothetical protein